MSGLVGRCIRGACWAGVSALVACEQPTVQAGHFVDAHVRYDVGEPGPGWREVVVKTANGAWFNDALSSSLMVNSHCDGVGDAPLVGLADDLLMGTTERAVLNERTLPFAGREALERTVTAKLDGVPRMLALFVLKKDNCVYDIVLDAPPEQFDDARTAYMHVRDGFQVAERRDRQGP